MSTFKTIVNSIVKNVDTARMYSDKYTRNDNSIGSLPAKAAIQSLFSSGTTVSTVIDSAFLLMTNQTQSHADDKTLHFAIPMMSAFGAVGIRFSGYQLYCWPLEETHKFGKV